MGSATLHWYSDRGFELDLEAAEDDVAIRLAAVPVPADGTVELREGVDLDRLDILFKAVVEINGEPGQLHDARIQLVDEEAGPSLNIDAKCEDAETGEIVPVRWTIGVAVPAGVPLRGGPRPVPTNEDDLDWEDETTLEQLVVNAPETPLTDDDDLGMPSGRAPAHKGTSKGGTSRGGTSKGGASGGRNGKDAGRAEPSRIPAGAGRGLQALLQALARVDDEETDAGLAGEDSEDLQGLRDDESPVEDGQGARAGKGQAGKGKAKAEPGKGRGKGAKAEEKPAGKKAAGKGGKAAAGKAAAGKATAVLPSLPPLSLDLDEDEADEAPSGPDQSLGADAEARGLLELLVEGGNLELEDDVEVDGLIPGVKKILSLKIAAEAKATKLSSWLLSQDQVADLFIGDDDLAEILERW